jgi:hypothetical protein
MKHLFLTLLLATLCATTSYGQTIKSLGFNSTNGQVVANTGTNTLTFTNALQFSTNARAATRTNLGGTTVGNSVFTATNAAAAATAIGLGTTNDATFNNITIANDGSLTLSEEGEASVFVRNDDGDLGLYGDTGITAHKPISFTNNNDASTTRTNLGLGGGLITNIVAGTNTLVFSNGILTGVNP